MLTKLTCYQPDLQGSEDINKCIIIVAHIQLHEQCNSYKHKPQNAAFFHPLSSTQQNTQ